MGLPKEEKDLKFRDDVIRTYILKRDWDENNEFQLTQKIVSLKYHDIMLNQSLQKYPYIFDYEYEVVPNLPQHGKGDLMLTDGEKNALIVKKKLN